VIYRVADVANRLQLQVAIDEIAEAFGGFDVLVNNAGMAHSVRIDTPLETTEQLWDDVLDTNLKGTFLACLAAVSHLSQPGGRIINIS
jgi:3-oxoacyl-[acyl-carrier protein] reductase